jgi:hypothetical protein
MRTKSRRALIQLSIVLVITVSVTTLMGLWKWEFVTDVFLADWRAIFLNGVVILIFWLGIGQLFRGLAHYTHEEHAIARFCRLRADGVESEAIFDDPDHESIIADRYLTIKTLFARGTPINHSAISAIMVAEESLYQSFPRFVNNVLILTGVFGTVCSLILALIGASSVLQTAIPGEGMGLMLLGMNTALTTTATAIVCYFLFTYFYQKLTDVQTYLFSQVERAVLLYIIPDFAFDTESVNHQTKLLIEEVRSLVRENRDGVGEIERTLAKSADLHEAQLQKWQTVLAGHEEQSSRLAGILSRLDDLRQVLVEGFRLK